MIDYIMHEDGMLIIDLNVDNNYLEVAISDQNINFIDGYAVIEFGIEELCYVSGIIDTNYKIATPFNVSKDDLKSITLFKNKKAIYEVTNKAGEQKFLLIDLANIKSILDGKKTIPLLNVIMEFDGYDDLDEEKAIILINNKYTVLDVSNTKLLNISFDDILESTDKKGNIETFGVINVEYTYQGLDLDVYYVDGKGMPSYNLYFKLSSNGTIMNPIYVNATELWLQEDKLDNLDYITSVVNDTFINQKEESVICKVLQ